MKNLLIILLVAFGLARPAAAAEGGVPWDRFPVDKLTDMAALQNGARLFVNYCLNCHSAAYMRYNRMRDLGLTEEQIKNNLVFSGAKVGDTMRVALDPRQAKDWFGAAPPDLTVIARSRASISHGSGADYLYTYLRTYYRDETKSTGWNNLVFPSVAMPHVLWELQGQRVARFTEVADPHDPVKKMQVFAGFEQLSPGRMSQQEYDDTVADLVGFIQWMGEPVQGKRVRIGVWVLLFLSIFILTTWRLSAAYWRSVR